MIKRLQHDLYYRWVVVGLYYTNVTSGAMLSSALGVMLPFITDDLNLAPYQQGIVGSAAFWPSLALGIPATWWFARYPVRATTTLSFLLSGLFFFVQGWAPVFGVLLGGRVLFGICRLASQPARAILIRQWFPGRDAVLATTLDNALFGVLFGGGLVAAQFFFRALGEDWRMTLHIFGALLVALTLVWFLLGRERTAAEGQGPAEPRDAGDLMGSLMHRDLWLTGLGFLGPSMCLAAFVHFFPTLLLDEYGESLWRWSGVVLAMATVVGGAAGVGFGYLVFVTGNRNLLLGILGLVMAGTYAGMTQTGSVPILLGLALLNGVTWGHWPVLAAVPLQLPNLRRREAALAASFSQTFGLGGLALGSLLAGFLYEVLGDLQQSLLIVSFLGLLLAVGGILLRPPPADVLAEVAAARQARSG